MLLYSTHSQHRAHSQYHSRINTTNTFMMRTLFISINILHNRARSHNRTHSHTMRALTPCTLSQLQTLLCSTQTIAIANVNMFCTHHITRSTGWKYSAMSILTRVGYLQKWPSFHLIMRSYCIDAFTNAQDDVLWGEYLWWYSPHILSGFIGLG